MLDRKQRNYLSEQGLYAYVATREALEQAGIDEAWLKENEAGILYGNDSCAEAVIRGTDIIREKKNTILVGSSNIFQSMNSTITMNLATIFNLRGINFTVSGACASGSHAIGMAYLLIRQGLQDCIICGGAEEVNIYSVGNFGNSSFNFAHVSSVRYSSASKRNSHFDGPWPEADRAVGSRSEPGAGTSLLAKSACPEGTCGPQI